MKFNTSDIARSSLFAVEGWLHSFVINSVDIAFRDVHLLYFWLDRTVKYTGRGS